jgi:hypothetical protein
VTVSGGLSFIIYQIRKVFNGAIEEEDYNIHLIISIEAAAQLPC